MHQINCKFSDYSGKNVRRGLCALGYYGGNVSIFLCLDCLKRGRNTPEAKAAFDAKAERAHPANRPRLSGCCDRADQA
jgi:hypothetical protein